MIDKLRNIHSSAWAMLWVMVGWMISASLSLPEPILWGYRALILFVLYRNFAKTDYNKTIDRPGAILVVVFFLWLFICFLRASHYAQGYWMWKMVVGQFLLSFLYIVVLISANSFIIRDYLRLYWFLSIPMMVLAFVMFKNPQYLNYMPFMLLVLFVVFLPGRKKWMLLLLLLIYSATFEHRNDMIKVLVAVLIGLSVGFGYNTLLNRFIKALHAVLLILPFILLFLGISGNFNVFKMDDYIKGDYNFTVRNSKEDNIRDFKVDTRTPIYENVFYTLNKYDSLILGRSPAFGDEGGTFEDDPISGLKGRYGNEVGVLDILLWYGIVGVLMYFLIFIRASYLAIYRSRNKISKGLGLFTAYLWFMSFIWEKPMFETFFMTDLIIIGLCLSKPFREMSDLQIQLWVRSIFVKQSLIKN